MDLDEEINDSWNHFWPLALKHQSPEHLELLELTRQLQQGELWGSIKLALVISL